MIKIEKVETTGWDQAIRGMRNPMNSWNKSDSDYRFFLGQKCEECGKYILEDDHSCDGCEINNIKLTPGQYGVGPNDLALMMRLIKGGPVEAKFRRMIVVYMDITAPLYWWKEFDTYKVGTVANSCSTMHKLTAKEFELDDFSHDHLSDQSLNVLREIVRYLNIHRNVYLSTNTKPDNSGKQLSENACEKLKKDIWWQMIQLLPSSYNQKRTIMVNYEVLSNIYAHRLTHKLDEWREFCMFIVGNLPYPEIFTGYPRN